MAKPRVIRVISDLPVGGVEGRLLALLPKLADKYDIRVCCIRARGALAGDFEQAGIPVTVKYFRSRLHPVSIYKLAAYMREEQIDIVHTHMYRPNISGVVAARLAKVPVIISQVHNVDHWDNKRQVFMDSLLTGWRDKVILVSKAVKQDYIEKTRIDPQKCEVIYNGVDTEKFKLPNKAIHLKEKWGISPADKVVGIIARIVPQKDHLTFISAAEKVYRSLPKVRFLIIGEEEGKCGVKAQLKTQITEMGLGKQVIFTGSQKNIADILSIMDVSILSSLKEGFSNVILESMAAGVPMVATKVGGNAEAIIDGETGFVIPPRSPQELAEAILNILQNDALAASMLKASLEQIKLFSLDTMCQKTDALYQALLFQKKPR